MTSRDQTLSDLIGFVRRRKITSILLIMAVGFGVGVSYVLIEYVGLKQDIKHLLPSGPEQLNFYSGSNQGFYNQIGTLLADTTADERAAEGEEQTRITIKKEPTLGAFSNLISVIGDEVGLGLVNEISVPKDDSLRDLVRYITPLYTERLHILYDHNRYLSEVGDTATAILSTDNASNLRKFFAPGRVGSEPVGSGARILVSHLLDELKISTAFLQHEGLGVGLRRLALGEISAYFTVLGAPIVSIDSLLMAKTRAEFPATASASADAIDIRLMGVEPALISRLRTRYGLNLRPADFNEKYKQENVPTVGNFAYLVASTSIPDATISEVLNILKSRRGKLRDELSPRLVYKVKGRDRTWFQLEELDFDTAFDIASAEARASHWEDLILVILSWIGSTVIAFQTLVYGVSSWTQHRYYTQITNVYEDHYPTPTGLVTTGKKDWPHLVPEFAKSNDIQIDTLVEGAQEIRKIIARAFDSYRDGWLTVTHYRDLMRVLDSNVENFRTALGRRLTGAPEAKEIPQDMRMRYYAAGFLKGPGRDDDLTS